MVELVNEVAIKKYIERAETLKKNSLSITENLYTQLGGCFKLYKDISTTSKSFQTALKDKLNDYAVAENNSKSNNVETAIVRYVFGKLSRDIVCKYAKTIKVIHDNNLANDSKTFAKYLLDNGGYTAINKEEDVAESNKSNPKVDYVMSRLELCKADTKEHPFEDRQVAIFATQKTDGTFTNHYIETDDAKVQSFISTSVYPILKEQNKDAEKISAELSKKVQSQFKKFKFDMTEEKLEAFNRVFADVDTAPQQEQVAV